MEEIHKRKAEVKRSKMLTDQAEARRQKNRDARKRRDDKSRAKLQELLKSLGDEVPEKKAEEKPVVAEKPAKAEQKQKEVVKEAPKKEAPKKEPAQKAAAPAEDSSKKSKKESKK